MDSVEPYNYPVEQRNNNVTVNVGNDQFELCLCGYFDFIQLLCRVKVIFPA